MSFTRRFGPLKYRFARFLGGLLAIALCAAPAIWAGNRPVRRVHSVRRISTVRRRTFHRFSHLRRRHVVSRRRTSRYASQRRAVRYRHTRRYRRRHYARSHRPARPRLSIPPTRAEQIQEALIQAGDLHSAPTGRWDSQTRQAMKEYQTQNGFQATGLPDAKSLMKMGLGPHPLPPQVDPLAQVQPASPTPNSPGLSPQ